ncbi:hypothetical protein Tco_0637847, partial [Tanacetum coccineum]
KVKVLSKFNQAEAIKESVQANMIIVVKNQLPKLLPKAMSDFVKPRLESTVRDVLQKNPINLFKSLFSSTTLDSFTEYELKNMLYDKMQQIGSVQEHQKHLDLYNALIGSISLDEAIAKGEIDPAKVLKKRRHDEKDEDPPAKFDKEKKRRKRKDYEASKYDQTSSSKKVCQEPSQGRKITKADLRGPTFKLLKGTCRNNIELEYNMKQRPLGHLTILVDFFFNNDLKYLKTGNQERKYTVSLTKTKAARSRLAAKSPHEVSSRMQILSVIRLTIDNQFGYGYLKEIVVRRSDLKEYTFREADFSRLHLNDIEDMFLLYVQLKIHNLTGDEIIALVNALRMFTRSIRCADWSGKLSEKAQHHQATNHLDGTLKMVRHNLNDMLHNSVLGYNHAMPKRAWTEKDQEQTDELLKMIDNLLLERRIMRSLECYVGGRTNETDYRLHGNTKDRTNADVSRRLRHELSPEQTQHGDNEDALVNIEGVEELKRIVRIKGVKKEALHTLRQKPRNAYAIRITKLIAGIKDSHHRPNDAMHNPPKLLKLLLKEVFFISQGD